MGRYYQKRPSEIVNIDDEYIAYCFDEVCYFYVAEAMDDEGKINWNKIKWDKEIEKNSKTNKGLLEFMQKYG
ncbi:hypothetical protein NE686_00570 [Tissierella carlieri]|uniref:Uncharacterized protein n=1 Tax=Tissierella carlieri TaxID=689904 RepID=A0ABT1S5F5_9FIRM|nr:hypothetical protein [Tissierella carlieri]MCQ4921562.1 hypothetical protein [Tissierella carlieri]